MHELPLVNKIFEIAVNHARMNNASKIKEIILGVGELTDIEDHWMNHYFDWISKETIASGAVLKINRIEVEWECEKCGNKFLNKGRENGVPVCGKCGETRELSLIKGREFLVEAITII